jgi:thymidine kinase
MATMIPGTQALDDFNWSAGEQRLYGLLELLPSTYYIFHSARWNEKRRRSELSPREYIEWREADFVVFYPPRGIIVFEVKDGNISFARDNGWVQTNRKTGDSKIIDPMLQAQISMFHFRKLLQSRIQSPCPYDVAAAVWFTSADRKYVTGSLPNNYQEQAVLWANDMASPEQAEMAIQGVFAFYSHGKIEPDPEVTKKVLDVLAPEFGAFASIRSNRLAAQAMFVRMTQEQSYLLDYLEEQQIAAIQGCAGTGKTMLAIQKAQRLAERDNVLFLCFNLLLKNFLQENYARDRLTITNLDSLFVLKTGKELPMGSARSQEKDDQILEFLLEWKDFQLNCQHIVVDEGQDFNSDHLQALYAIAQEHGGCFYVFYDKYQFIQGQEFPQWIHDMDCRLVLTRNCRNTKEIAITSTRPVGIDESRIKMRLEAQESAEYVTKPKLYIVKDKAALIEYLDALITKYLNAGVPRESIVVLSMKSTGASILTESDFALTSQNRLTSAKEKGKILFTTVRKFKGLEGEVVLCIDIEATTFSNQRQRNVFYVGTSRAQSYLEMLMILPDEDAENNFADMIRPEGNRLRARAAIAMGLKVKIGTMNDLYE